MSQHDMNIANQGFPAFRADLNDALAALASTSTGATEPSTTFAQQLWYDSTANLLKMRNTDNDAWITLAYFDQTNDEWEVRSAVIQAVDSAGVTIKADNGESFIACADDGAVTLYYDNSAKLATTATGIDVTGTVTASGQILSTASSGASFKNATPTTSNNYMWLGNTGNNLYVGKESSAGGTLFVGSSAYAGVIGNDGPYSLQFATNNNVRATIDSSGNFAFNSGYGSVSTAYGCRAWVNFNGTGTVAIRDSGNVSSITDNAQGRYTANISTALVDTNGAVVASGQRYAASVSRAGGVYANMSTTTAIRIHTGYEDTFTGPVATDLEFVQIGVFR